MGRVTERRRVEERRSEKRKSQKKEDADARKGRKVAIHCVFPMICGSGGSKSRLAKAAGAEPSGQMRDEKLHAVVARSTFRSQNVQKHTSSAPLLAVEMSKKFTPLWREAHFEVKMYKTHQRRTTFGVADVEKVHAVVARSTFRSQNVQNTPLFGPLLEVAMSKKCTTLWREAHFEVKRYKTHQGFGPLLEVQMSKKCTPLWREAHFEVKMLKTLGVRTTFGGSDVASLRFATLHYITLHYTPLGHTLHYTPVHYTLNYTTPHYITLHYAPLHYTTLHHTTLHYTPLHYITLYYTIFHYTSLPYTTLHSITLQLQLHNYTQLHSTTLHYTPLHY